MPIPLSDDDDEGWFNFFNKDEYDRWSSEGNIYTRTDGDDVLQLSINPCEYGLGLFTCASHRSDETLGSAFGRILTTYITRSDALAYARSLGRNDIGVFARSAPAVKPFTYAVVEVAPPFFYANHAEEGHRLCNTIMRPNGRVQVSIKADGKVRRIPSGTELRWDYYDELYRL